MGSLPGSHEIEELTEKYDSESKDDDNAGNQHWGKPKKYAIEDDINKLFEAIEIGSSRHVRNALHKSAMKRPMRVGYSQVSGIGISEPVSLKQALRGLCISQASEMAAVKKRMSRPSASSPAVSESGAIKRLYRAVVIESRDDGRPVDESKKNLVEISLVPERSLSNNSDKASDFKNVSISEISERKSESEENRSLNLLELDEISGESSITVSGPDKERVDKLKSASLSSSFNVDSKVIKSSKRGFDSSKQSLKAQNLVKKKIVPKASIVPKSLGKHSEGAKNDHDQTPYSITEKRIKTDEKSKGEISQSSKSSIGEYSSTTSYSEESYLSGSSRSGYRPHMSKDLRWEAISCIQKQHGSLSLRHFKLLKKLGGGDIGKVYLSELIGTSCLFAVKVMDNEFLGSRKKRVRAQTEKEILEILDHPFLPRLYAYFTTNKFSCLVMDYCPGGDLHVLRQKQLTKSFPEKAARFYVAEVLLALEYLHMLGVVYRDLKPENILVREDGHIMLTDFDLSLRCTVNPMLLNSSSPDIRPGPTKKMSSPKMSSPCSDSSCIDPFCLQPSWQLSCFTPRFLSTASKTRKLKSEVANQIIPLPQLVVEPTSARSNSFVGTHEYLAPEIIKGEGHGSPVDWWTFGIFLYELLYGKTPFKGSTNEDTISNVVSQSLKFPERPMVSSHARDLIRRLLKKEPDSRLGSEKGAAEIKQHSFFEGLNWALIRCETPPEVPKFFDLGNVVPDMNSHSKNSKCSTEFECRGDEIEFQMF
ncbi:hypothetical protein BUALT_Bualt13G0061200 [Buddleja alternifolia]|uniref:non-specific serine/threonine protein kinase n=1 Tax=Buddleja alternifolia TaxID=168488 RepID=A0AAV6WW73_9LAMI|nr:hypothetical protein BUALT_Bualt13G0061200 [Buddleja alternifolia]